jgi:hypothetical protein
MSCASGSPKPRERDWMFVSVSATSSKLSLAAIDVYEADRGCRERYKSLSHLLILLLSLLTLFLYLKVQKL